MARRGAPVSYFRDAPGQAPADAAVEPAASRGYAEIMDDLDALIQDEDEHRRGRDAAEAEARRLELERLDALPVEERMAALLQKMAEFQAELNDLLPRVAAIDPDAWDDGSPPG